MNETEIAIQFRMANAEATARKLRNLADALKDPALLKHANDLTAAQEKLAALRRRDGTAYSRELLAQIQLLRQKSSELGKIGKAHESILREQRRADRMAAGGHYTGGHAAAASGRSGVMLSSVIPGFMQGMGAGVFFRGGPKFLGGFAAGRVARFGGGFLRAPFLAGGLGAAAALLPLLGSTVSAGMNMGLSAANRARGAQVDLQALLESAGGAQGGGIPALQTLAAGDTLTELGRTQTARNEWENRPRYKKGWLSRERPGLRSVPTTVHAAEMERLRDKEAYLQNRLDQQMTRATRDDAISQFAIEGQRFGFKPDEAIQRTTQILTGAAGTTDEAGIRLGIQSMAAQRAIGLGADAAGKIGRFANLTGRDGAELMNQMFADAIAAGMNRSETREFMETMADELVQIRKTGLELDYGALGRQIIGLTDVGMRSERATQIATGFSQMAQNAVFSGGPQSGIDILQLQHMGGLRNLSLSGIASAYRSLEGGGVEGGQQAFVQSLLKGAGLAGRSSDVQAFALQQLLAPRGIQMSADEAKMVAAGRVARESGAGASLYQAGLAGTGASLQRDAAVTAREVIGGLGLLPAVQEIEEAQMRTVTAMGKFEGALEKLAESVTDVANSVHGMVGTPFIPGLDVTGTGSPRP